MLCFNFFLTKSNTDAMMTFTDAETGKTSHTRQFFVLCFNVAQPQSDIHTTNTDVLRRMGQVIFRDKLLHERWQCSSTFYDCSDLIETITIPFSVAESPQDFYQNVGNSARAFYVNAGIVQDIPWNYDTQQTFFGYRHAHLQDRNAFANLIKLAKEGDTSVVISLQMIDVKKFSNAVQQMLKHSISFIHAIPGITLNFSTVLITKDASTDPTIGAA